MAESCCFRAFHITLRAIAALLFALAPIACAENIQSRKDVPLIPTDVKELKFETPELQTRFEAFDAAARATADDTYAHRALARGRGNFVAAVWAKGIDLKADRLQFREAIENLKPIHRIRVETLVFPFPDARATALYMEFVAARPDKWCVNFSYCEGANQNTYQPGWGLHFYRWDSSQFGIQPFTPDQHTSIRMDLPVAQYSFSANTVELKSPLSINDQFVRYAKSAEDLRDATLADLDELEKKVIELISGHNSKKRVYGKSTKVSGCAPPPHTLQPLLAHEEKAEIANAQQYFATQRNLIRTHHRAMYDVLCKSFPIARCWPELADDE